MKKCGRCQQQVSKTDFYRNYRSSDGLRSICKKCSNKECKEYYSKNKDIWIKHYFKEYYKEHKAEYNFRNSTRDNLKLSATPDWLTKDQLKSIEWFYIEAKRLEDLDGIVRHVDHIVPIKGKEVCGLHVPWNLQILTASENISKGNRV